MKKQIFATLFLLLIVLLSNDAQAQQWWPWRKSSQQQTNNTTYNYNTFCIRDMVLIYQGGTNRLDWTANQFVPYVTHTFADGTTDWLFDGFLFIEFKDNKGNYFYPKNGTKPSDLAGWTWYLGRLFEKGKSLDALDKCIDNMKQKLGTPNFKHRIVLTVPTPMSGTTKWGTLNGKTLNMNKEADQIKAVKWFTDELISRFNAGKYKNLELVGIYWLNENTNVYKNTINTLSNYIHSKNLAFIMIPYYNASKSASFDTTPFDMVYLQPNYFMYPEMKSTQVEEACQRASSKNLGLEFECDERALSKNKGYSSYISRMQKYVDGFNKCGVFTSSSIAYYLGGRYLYDAYVLRNKDDQKIIDQFARKIVERRGYTKLSVERKSYR